MTRRAIRNFRAGGIMPPRFCDAINDNGKLYLETKNGKGDYMRIPWEDVVYQVKDLKEEDNG